MHTYDADRFQEKLSLNNQEIEDGKCISDESILIDPRHTQAFTSKDENLKVLDSEYTQQDTLFDTYYQQNRFDSNCNKNTSTTSECSSSSSLLHLPNEYDHKKSPSNFYRI